MVAKNVLAHVPDINDFVAGFALLGAGGVSHSNSRIFFDLVRKSIRHDLSRAFHLPVARRHASGCSAERTAVFDVAKSRPTAESLRCSSATSEQRSGRPASPTSEAARALGGARGRRGTPGFYEGFRRKSSGQEEFVGFSRPGQGGCKRVAAYGAAAKGNTLMNTCRVGRSRFTSPSTAIPPSRASFCPEAASRFSTISASSSAMI